MGIGLRADNKSIEIVKMIGTWVSLGVAMN